MAELIGDVRNTLNDLRTTIGQYRGQIDQLLQGNISIKLNLAPRQKIVLAIFLALLFGIVLGLIYNRSGKPSPTILCVCILIVAIIIYFLL